MAYTIPEARQPWVVNGTHSFPANKKSQSPCREKARLFGAYNAAASELAIAMANLEDQIAVLSMAAYENLSRKTDLVRIKWQGARLDLETHVFKHCCEGSVPIDYAARSAPFAGFEQRHMEVDVKETR